MKRKISSLCLRWISQRIHLLRPVTPAPAGGAAANSHFLLTNCLFAPALLQYLAK